MDTPARPQSAPLTQSSLESAIESTLNIASGFVVSWLVWLFAVPLVFGEVTLGDPEVALSLTGLFTITSWLRSYVWRRYFNARLHRRVHQLLGDS